jgi:hypothetical protein
MSKGLEGAATIVRSFELIQQGHPTSISVGEMSNGTMCIKVKTKRDGCDTIATGMVLGPVAFSLLSEAMFRAAHDESVWQVAPNKENENDR